MIKPWQVWMTHDGHYVVVASSDFHLRLTVGRQAIVVPVSSEQRGVDYRVGITSPVDGREWWVITEQVRTLNTVGWLEGDQPAWELNTVETAQIKAALAMMVDFA